MTQSGESCATMDMQNLLSKTGQSYHMATSELVFDINQHRLPLLEEMGLNVPSVAS